MEKETELQAEIIEILEWIVAQFSIWIYEYEKKTNPLTAEVPPLFVTFLEHSKQIFPLCISICTELLHFLNFEKFRDSKAFPPVQIIWISSFKFCLPFGTDEKLQRRK